MRKIIFVLSLIIISLSLYCFDFATAKKTQTIEKAVIKDGIQSVKITVNERGFTPQTIVVQKGIKTVFTFVPERLTGCNSTVVFPDFDTALYLRKNQLISPELSFTKDSEIQCWMNMIRTKIKVVDNLEKADLTKIQK